MGKSDSILHGDPPVAVAPRASTDRKELASTAFERTRMPMVVTDATQDDHPIVLANQAFLELTGYDVDEVLGRNCRFLQGPGTSPAAVSQIRAALREGREVGGVELLNYRKDGTSFWNLLHFSPIHDDDGHLIYHFGSQIDTTELRKVQSLERSEHRLLLEVDHRANNALALVDSIVRLTRSADPAHYAASVQHRVQALARAHGLLARCGWHKIPLRDTIKAQIGPDREARTALEGPEIMLAAHVVQPLSLFIHELAVNATSHGSLLNERGRVNIRWHGNAESKGIKLVWEEVGGGPQPTAGRAGFGTVITEATIRRQLQGTAEREWTDGGLRVLVDLPAATAEM
jgi:PAS domain S-box-containing protein